MYGTTGYFVRSIHQKHTFRLGPIYGHMGFCCVLSYMWVRNILFAIVTVIIIIHRHRWMHELQIYLIPSKVEETQLDGAQTSSAYIRLHGTCFLGIGWRI